jgi:hypothetical protein
MRFCKTRVGFKRPRRASNRAGRQRGVVPSWTAAARALVSAAIVTAPPSPGLIHHLDRVSVGHLVRGVEKQDVVPRARRTCA